MADYPSMADFPTKDDWADAVLKHLPVKAQSACTEVLVKDFSVKPCPKCRKAGCANRCYWKAVRYWRNLERGGTAAEGYDKPSCSLARLRANVGSQVDLED